MQLQIGGKEAGLSSEVRGNISLDNAEIRDFHLCYTELLRGEQGAAIQTDLQPKISPCRGRVLSLLNEKSHCVGR